MAKRRASKRRPKRRGKSKGDQSTPDVPKSEKDIPADEAGAFPLSSGEMDGTSEEAVPPPVINVPAKPVVGTAKTSSAEAPRPQSEKPGGDGSEEKSLEWRRKARSRRLQANASDAGNSEVSGAKDYEPEFAPLRMPDWSPEFDQLDEQGPGTAAPARRRPFDSRWYWLLIAGGVLAVVLATGTVVLLWFRNHFESNRRSAQEEADKLPAVVQQNTIRATVDLVPHARRTVELFFAATTPEEKTPLVRGGQALLPAMRAYYASHPDEPATLTLASSVEFAADGDREFIIITGADANSVPVNAVVELIPDGPRLDWRYLTGAGEVEWDPWIAERPPGAVQHRVIASLDDYYSGKFADARTWICLKVTGISRSVTAWAYAERGSTTGISILRHLSGSIAPVRLQGRFQFPEESRAAAPGGIRTPQLFLHSVEETGWLDRSADATGATVIPAIPRDILPESR